MIATLRNVADRVALVLASTIREIAEDLETAIVNRHAERIYR